MNKNEMNSKPRRAQGGMGLLSRTISVQNPQVSIPLIHREEREEVEKEEGAWERSYLLCLCARGKKRERGRGGEGVFNPNNSQPKKLNTPRAKKN